MRHHRYTARQGTAHAIRPDAFGWLFDEIDTPAGHRRVGPVAIVPVRGSLAQRGSWWATGYDDIVSRFEAALATDASTILLDIDPRPGGLLAEPGTVKMAIIEELLKQARLVCWPAGDGTEVEALQHELLAMAERIQSMLAARNTVMRPGNGPPRYSFTHTARLVTWVNVFPVIVPATTPGVEAQGCRIWPVLPRPVASGENPLARASAWRLGLSGMLAKVWATASLVAVVGTMTMGSALLPVMLR